MRATADVDLEALTRRDAWASGDGPTLDDARAAVAAPTLREAMRALRYGPVADYFAYRWSDPTYLSGLALLDAHAGEARTVLELACGIGHYLRELTGRGSAATGLDVVPSKAWLAQRFVAPDAEVGVHDAGDPLPFADDAFDLVVVHDALHYLPDKDQVAAELRRVGRAVVVGHAHNALVENLSPGAPLDPDGYAALFPRARLYDDAELTRAALTGAPAPQRTARELAGSEAIALVWGDTRPDGRFTVPPPGAALRRNPLLDARGEVRWPSERYEQEYAEQSDHLRPPFPTEVPEEAVMSDTVCELARRRLLLDLPEAW